MNSRTARRGTRVVMLFRRGVRNDPRLLKQARTLCDAGLRVIVVAMKVPGESEAVERLGPGLVVVRTETGFLRRARRLFKPPGVMRSLGGPKRPSVESNATEQPIATGRLGLMLVSRILIAIKLAGLALRARPNAIQANDFSALPAAWIAAVLARVPLIYDAYEVNVDREGYYRQLRGLIYRMESFLIRRCDRVITTTDLRARHFRRVYRLEATPVVLQNRPVYRRASGSGELRAMFAVPERALLCIYQGGLQEGRGLRNLVEATAAVEGVHTVLLGEGHQADALRELAHGLGVAERVHHHARVPLRAVQEITASADVGVQVIRNTCFNHWSTDSNKLFEYAMAGLPVIASDFPEIRKIVTRYGFGILVNPDSVANIAHALWSLRNDTSLRCRLQAAAKASGEALSWSSQAPILLALYKGLGLIPASSRPRCV